MLVTIPFQPSDNNIELLVTLDQDAYVFFHRWNSRDNAWYLDLYESDFTPILLGCKLVLGTQIGQHCPDPFFTAYSLNLIDTSGQNLDPGFDDLGGRVVLVVDSANDFATFLTNGTSQ